VDGSGVHDQTGVPDVLVNVVSARLSRGEDQANGLLSSEKLEADDMVSQNGKSSLQNLLRRQGAGAHVDVESIGSGSRGSGTLHAGVVAVFDDRFSTAQLRAGKSWRGRTGALHGASACDLGEGTSWLRIQGHRQIAIRKCTGVAGACQRS
jgi:hypothetical protein